MTSIDKNIFNTDSNIYKTRNLFLGEKMGLIEEINQHYPDILALHDRLTAMNWHRDEFDYKPCNAEFKSAPKNIYDMMLLNIRYQWCLDSIVTRSVSGVIHPFVSSSELYTAWANVANNECVTGDHEVLTPKGWKRIDQITNEDKVAQWDYETYNISFVNPEQIIVKHYEGPMYAFYDNNRNLSQITTPDHRMPILHYRWNSNYYSKDKLSKEVNYHGGNCLPTSGYIKSNKKRMTRAERLYIAVQAQGQLCPEEYKNENTDMLYYKFVLSNQRKINKLTTLCNLANWQIREVNNDSNTKTFYVYVPKSEYNWSAKTFDWFDLDQIDSKWALHFIWELQSWNKTIKYGDRIRYCTKDKNVADKVATLAHLAGKRARISTIYLNVDHSMPDSDISNTKVAYEVCIFDKPHIEGNFINKSVIDYSGNVYCITVPSGYFLVRHNDAISVTGNCLHSLTYSTILRNSFDDPSVVLEDTLSFKEIIDRLEPISHQIAVTYEVGNRYALGYLKNNQNTYNAIFMFVIVMLLIERVQFMASFAVTFSIAELGMFLPIASAVKKIMDDELSIHVELDKAILRHELKTERGQIAFKENVDQIKCLISSVIEAEFAWVDFLFSEGRELVGVTPDLLKKWVLWCARDVYNFLGIESPYQLPTANPLPFMDIWIRNDHQPSPQEEKSVAYMLGMVKDDAGDKIFEIE